MKFSKDDTLCMKGIAILILFFHHNYLGPDRWLNSPISFYPFSQSQIMYIAKFLKICVGMFVFLTGYGMLASVKTKSLDDKAMRIYGQSVFNYDDGILVDLFTGTHFIRNIYRSIHRGLWDRHILCYLLSD